MLCEGRLHIKKSCPGITLYLPNPYRWVLLQQLSHSASQEIPHLLWNLNIQYCVCNRQPQIPIQRPAIRICTLPHHFRSILYHPPIHRGLSSGIFLSVLFQSHAVQQEWGRNNYNGYWCSKYILHLGLQLYRLLNHSVSNEEVS